MNSEDTDSIYLTCKDYKTIKGVASYLNKKDKLNDPKAWYVKGPMGMGLNLNMNGHNIVFTGGTGILVFLDLIAVMIL